MILQTLTHSEEEIMQLVWSKENIYFRELMDIFPEPKPHQNTVSTFLKILVDKNYLKTEKEGRIYLYSPTIGFDEYKKFVLKRFLENYFDNSGSELLRVMIKENIVTKEDINHFFDIKTAKKAARKENHIQDFIKEITGDKKSKKDKKKRKKDKKK